MTKPGPKDIEPVRLYSVDEFERWIRIGFESLVNGDSTSVTLPFDPLDVFIDLNEDLTLDLKAIYDAFPPQTQDNFRRGLAAALSHLPSTKRSVRVFQELLFLASAIKAHEVLPVLPTKVGNGFFGIAETSDKRKIFVTTLDTIASMASLDTVNRNVPKVIKTLINSRFFISEYADTAFIALCQVSPEKFPEHLEELREHFNKLLKDKIITFNQTQELTWQFVNSIGLNVIADNLQYLKAYPAQRKEPSDYWFLKALFGGDQPPLFPRVGEDEEGKNQYFIQRNDKPEQQALINLEFNSNYKRVSDLIGVLDSFWKELLDKFVKKISNPNFELPDLTPLQRNLGSSVMPSEFY